MVKKKHTEEPHEEHADETWLIPYSDLLTLLLALFIVLFASSSLDKKKAAMIEAAFTQAFSPSSGGQINGGLMDFLDDVGGLDLGEGISLGTDNRGVVIEISSVSLFDQDGTEVKKKIIPDLNKIAALLKEPRYRRFQVVVEGHTDDTPSQRYKSNWDLSSLRASSVVQVLVESGVDLNRFKVVGMSNIAPKYPNEDALGNPILGNRERNRRVVIRVEPY